MPIKAVILDRDGTLYNEFKGLLQPGIREMLDRLQGLGLELFVVSNEARDSTVEKLIDLPASRFLYSATCGLKGRHGFVNSVLDQTGFKLNEIVYLGDSDNDMHEAAGCRVALFNAEWSNPQYPYGLRMETPSDFVDCLEIYFLKQDLWFFSVDGSDALGRGIMFRALLDPDTCKDNGITGLLKNRDTDFTKNEYTNRKAVHLVMHLLASLYLEGLHLIREPRKPKGFRKPLWCIYPGSTGGISPILRLFERFTARLLTMNYEESTLQRHANVDSSHKMRMAINQGKGGSMPSIATQFNSVSVNPNQITKVNGNVVLVVDDFSTGSNAMETSRNLLMNCGAKKVIGLSVGKYGSTYFGFTPKADVKLPKRGGPLQTPIDDANLTSQRMNATINQAAIDAFEKGL